MNNEEMSWAQAARVYLDRRVAAMAVLGLGAGLPFLLVFSTLSAWLNEAEVSRSQIGFFAWVGITYSVKFIWSPVVDQWRLPLLGRFGQRRSWIILGQLGIALALLGMSTLEPAQELFWVALLAVAVAFSSSTQDIALDAFRIEKAPPSLQGAMSASYIFGYRLGLLVAGAGVLYLAEYFDWQRAYLCMGLVMVLPMVVVLLSSEPPREPSVPVVAKLTDTRWQRIMRRVNIAVVQPFMDFFRRNGSLALWILVTIGVYRLSDITMGIMANPFYLDLGFSKTQIADVAKVFGFFMTIAGSFLCGSLVVRYGLYRPLLLGAILVAVTNLLFAFMAGQPPSILMLAVVVSADNLSGGIASTALVAFLSSLTNRQYTATQYALFSSLMTLPGKFFSGFSGLVVDTQGYVTFFTIAALLGLPAIFMVVGLMRKRHIIDANSASVH
jgi:PAT family beta-lactamase induction signal transducer AmpG